MRMLLDLRKSKNIKKKIANYFCLLLSFSFSFDEKKYICKIFCHFHIGTEDINKLMEEKNFLSYFIDYYIGFWKYLGKKKLEGKRKFDLFLDFPAHNAKIFQYMKIKYPFISWFLSLIFGNLFFYIIKIDN